MNEEKSKNNARSGYKDLLVWQKGVACVKAIYRSIEGFPDSEKFVISDQMKRAAVSIPCNIAEGWGRNSRKETVRFLQIARGSALELETLLLVSEGLGHMKEKEAEELTLKVEELSKMLHGLAVSLKEKY